MKNDLIDNRLIFRLTFNTHAVFDAHESHFYGKIGGRKEILIQCKVIDTGEAD